MSANGAAGRFGVFPAAGTRCPGTAEQTKLLPRFRNIVAYGPGRTTVTGLAMAFRGATHTRLHPFDRGYTKKTEAVFQRLGCGIGQCKTPWVSGDRVLLVQQIKGLGKLKEVRAEHVG